MPGQLSPAETLRYSRHLLLSEVGEDGQEKLRASSALVIGVGGLGSAAALYLAAAGVGRIGLVDNDVVEVSNLQRQVIYGTGDVGKSKVAAARARLLDLNPDVQIEIYNETFSAQNARRIAEGYDLLLDGSDNFRTRYLVNDLCVLTGRPDVYASVFRFEGQASVFYATEGPCYRCLFPEPPAPGVVPSCAEAGVLGVLPGTMGTLQAAEALKLLLGIGSSLVGRLVFFDALEMSFREVKLKKNPACKLCGADPQITDLMGQDFYCDIPDEKEENLASMSR